MKTGATSSSPSSGPGAAGTAGPAAAPGSSSRGPPPPAGPRAGEGGSADGSLKMSGKVSAPSRSGRGAGGGRRRPDSVGGPMASSRSRSDWLLRIAVDRGRRDALAHGARGDRGPLAAAADEVAQGRARDQDHGGDQTRRHDDAGADVPDRRAGGPVPQLAEVAAALAHDVVREPRVALDPAEPEDPAGQRDQQRRRAERGPQPQRRRICQRVVEDEGDADRDQGERAPGRRRVRSAGGARPPATRRPGRCRSPGRA